MNSFYDASKEDASAFAGRVCRESWNNSRFVQVNSDSEHFRSKRRWTYQNLPLSLYPDDIRAIIQKHGWAYFWKSAYSQTGGPDGIGTAVEFANVLQEYRTMAFNLIAMSADDVAAGWDLPLVYTDVIDYKQLKSKKQKTAYAHLFEGLGKAARENDFIILTGESAGLSHCVSSSNPDALFPFNWSGTMNGVSHPSLQINGENIAAGDYIIALEQPWFATNGISKVREAFARKYGPMWFRDAPREEVEQAMAAPIIYARALSEVNGWYSDWEKRVEMGSISHLSGGSMKSKFLDDLLAPRGLSARLNNLFVIPEITRKAVEWLTLHFDSLETAQIYGQDKRDGTPMSMQELFTTWCCGQRMFITVKTEKEAHRLVAEFSRLKIGSQLAGEIITTSKSDTPHLEVTARFEWWKGKVVRVESGNN